MSGWDQHHDLDTQPSWPVCGAELHYGGSVLVCELPRHHERDGEQMHRDPKVGHWSATWTLVDGSQVTL